MKTFQTKTGVTLTLIEGEGQSTFSRDVECHANRMQIRAVDEYFTPTEIRPLETDGAYMLDDSDELDVDGMIDKLHRLFK